MSDLIEGGWSQPSAPIRALTSGYPSPYREEKPLAFLQAFIDDSASEVADQRLVMAGYVNGAEIWASFADAWAKELKAPPSIKYLKMVEANNLRDQFKGWPAEDRDEKLRRLAQTIRHFGPILSFDFSISRRTYYQEVRPVAPRGIGNPYFPCAFSVVSGVSRFFHDREIRAPIDFIFDEQLGVSDDIDFFFEYMRAHLPKGARNLINGRPIFRDDQLFLPLQAADMLAWHIRREHEIGDLGTLPMANTLRNSDGHLCCHIEDDVVRTWSDEMDREMAGVPPLQSKSQWRNVKRGMARSLALGFVPPYGSRWKNALYSARKRLARLFRS
jgi:Protein of unknown function (DUF3800)